MTRQQTALPLRSGAAIAVALLAVAGFFAPATPAPASAAQTTADVPVRQLVNGPLGVPTDATIALSLRASGLTKPVFITSANDGTGRMFIVQQNGVIKILDGGNVLGMPFLSIPNQVNHGSEEGLLGLAFHPDYESNRKFYVYLTNTHGNNVVREYHTSSGNPNVASVGTMRVVIAIPHPGQANHNGGMIGFGFSGKLFIGTGDGGGSGDSGNNAQDKDSLLGKMLRIDVDARPHGKAYGIPSGNPYIGKPGRNEIWQIGLRNPWRWSLDRGTGDMWIGDVGQNRWEEIDRAPQGPSGPGRGINWGWRVLEGNHCFKPPSGCSTSGKTRPITEYNHAGGRCAVTGGYVYRGSAIPALVGGYLFADYCSGELWVVNSTAPAGTARTLLLDTNLLISGFGENPAGELYVTDLGGRIYQIVQG